MSKRVLSVFSLVMINVIAIDSLRNLPTNAAMGLSIPAFYLLSTLVFLVPSLLITAELATNWPKTGGVYVWVREAFGPRWGFLTVWLQWIYNVFWYPTILSFTAMNIAYLVHPAWAQDKMFILPVVVALFTLATAANCYGMKLSSFVSSVSTMFGAIIPMALLILFGIIWVLKGEPLAITPSVKNFIPHLNNTPNLAFLVGVFFSLMGIELSAVHAESVKNPKRDYPKALYYSALIIVIGVTFSSTAIALVVPQNAIDILSGLNQAFEIFLKTFHLQALLPFTILIIILGSFGSMAAWALGPTKALMIAAQDDNAPKVFAYENKKGSPIVVLIIQAIIVVLLCGLFLLIDSFNASYWILSDLTAQMALLYYILLFAAAIKLRGKQKRNPNAFYIPGGKIGLWIVGGTGLISSLAAFFIGFLPPQGAGITNLKVFELILIGGLILFVVPPFFIYKFSRRKQQKSLIDTSDLETQTQ